MPGEKLYRIGEVATMLGLRTSVLRFWESEFPAVAPARTDRGHRLYSEENVAVLRRVKELLHGQGMTIEGARRVMESGVAGPSPVEALTGRARDRDLMREVLEELDAIRELLTSGDKK